MYFGRTGSTPPVVKNLIIINALMFLGTMGILQAYNVDLNHTLGLYFFRSPLFYPFQVITHMFMHGSLGHIFFNMFALWMFGKVLEQVWGSKRFLIYYFVTGLGAVFLHSLVLYLELHPLMNYVSQTYGIDTFTPDVVDRLYSMGDIKAKELAVGLLTPTIGASGAVFGVLLAFGMLFPNTQLMLLFPPIPIKAKYFVIGYGLIELYLGLMQPGSNVAHFAHLGGMLFGFVLIKLWKKDRTSFY
ncbi:MAG: rhomboid family intramembrane serine protease [Bacteroidales bacterium]|nr:rhomboid family intramembrane serine protease [Bacteroidales bacterium]MCB8998601.1 rhomboid family intramembrane serine protease [Bacteroidales bacterium]MCB9012531.1 rhomboid family intramembrane serine protease [Bacteroidales bacterium]